MNNLTSHPTWTILDSTKIKEYMRCPRLYFYHYILGWQFNEPSIDLEFGTGWHQAMEYLLQHDYSKQSVEEAHKLLLMHYRKHFAEIMDDSYFPKNPGFAKEMLDRYIRKFPRDHEQHRVLYTETSGTVMIRPDRVIYFKTDSILQGINGAYQNKYFSREHKTAGRRGNLWGLSFQVGTYNHVLYCLFPEDQVYGVEINEAIFQKTKPDFERTQVIRGPRSMHEWLWNANYWYGEIERETEIVTDLSDSDQVMKAFPCNTEGCNHYGKCTFYDYCIAWQNPLQHLDRIPQGMTTRFWDPREQETTNKMEL